MSVKLKIGSKRVMKREDTQETINAVRPTFNYRPKKWAPPFKNNMNAAWRDLDIKGVNYFTFGKPGLFRQYINRSNYRSKYYQAWFGTYIIEAKQDVFGMPNQQINNAPDRGIQEFGKVAEKDQTAWLTALGDTSPMARTVSFEPIKSVKINGTTVQIFEGTMESHSDLTDKRTRWSKLLGMPKPKKWSGKLDRNHSIALKGIYGIWYDANDQTIKIVYGCGSIIKLKDGRTFDYYTQIKDELLEMAENVSYIPLKLDR